MKEGRFVMKAKRVKMTIPRKAVEDTVTKIEIMGQADMPSADSMLLSMLDRIYEEGGDKRHGIAGTSEEQGAAS